MQSLKNQMENNLENRFWLSLSQRTHLDLKSQNLLKIPVIPYVAIEGDSTYLF